MDIYGMSQCPTLRPVVGKMFDGVDETGEPIFREGLRELMGKDYDNWLYSSVSCERCERKVMIRWLRTPSQDGVAMLIRNPSRYLLEDEIIVCSDCTRKIASRDGVLIYSQQCCDNANCGWMISGILQYVTPLHKDSDKFEFKHIRQWSFGMGIYNTKYNYYMCINSYSRIDKNKISDLQKRASNFMKYDPYVVHRITLFELLYHNL
jgi:hypothetical protein